MNLDKEVIAKLFPAIYNVWQMIGDDYLAVVAECGNEDVSNYEAVSTCIDAGRLNEFGFPDEDKLVHELIKEHGYTKCLTFLCTNIQLV